MGAYSCVNYFYCILKRPLKQLTSISKQTNKQTNKQTELTKTSQIKPAIQGIEMSSLTISNFVCNQILCRWKSPIESQWTIIYVYTLIKDTCLSPKVS